MSSSGRHLHIVTHDAPAEGEPVSGVAARLSDALAARDAARRRVAVLEERVTFLEEQVRSTRAYFAALAEGDRAELQRERAMLLQEIDMLTDALRSARR